MELTCPGSEALHASLMSRLQRFDSPRTRLRSVGVFLPDTIVDNQSLVNTLNVHPNLRRRLPTLLERLTGIQTRRYAAEGTPPSTLALQAALIALEKAGLEPSDIDTLIFASTDSDVMEPATANILQEKLGIKAVNSFDIKNACNSVLQAINIANSLVSAGAARRVLIASGEVGSYVCNRTIEDIPALETKLGGLTLGDAGAALVLEATTGSSGIQEINLMTLGEHWPLCHVPDNPSWRQHPVERMGLWFYLKMSGLAEVARNWTTHYLREYFTYRRERCGEEHPQHSIDGLIPHQISKRFIDEIKKNLQLDDSKVAIIADRYGNTASTAIPLALHTMLEEGVLSWGSGQEVLLFGAASGFSIGHIRIKM